MRVTVMAVKSEIATPIPRVSAKPLTAGAPIEYRMIQVMIVQILESRIALKARRNPASMA